jgi:hypothetical protein
MSYILILGMCLFVGLMAILAIMKLATSVAKAEEEFKESERETTMEEDSMFESIVDTLGGYIYDVGAVAAGLMLYGFFLAG